MAAASNNNMIAGAALFGGEYLTLAAPKTSVLNALLFHPRSTHPTPISITNHQQTTSNSSTSSNSIQKPRRNGTKGSTKGTDRMILLQTRPKLTLFHQTPTTAGKAPAGKAPAEKKEAGKKTAAAGGEKKKRTKTRKETYSSYIYKGTP